MNEPVLLVHTTAVRPKSSVTEVRETTAPCLAILRTVTVTTEAACAGISSGNTATVTAKPNNMAANTPTFESRAITATAIPPAKRGAVST